VVDVPPVAFDDDGRASTTSGWNPALQAQEEACGIPPQAIATSESRAGAERLSIINDASSPAGDRLRAMEELESRALGKPKETVEQVKEEPEELAAMRAISPEARRILLRRMNEAERQARSSSED